MAFDFFDPGSTNPGGGRAVIFSVRYSTKEKKTNLRKLEEGISILNYEVMAGTLAEKIACQSELHTLLYKGSSYRYRVR